ncbi:MAG: alpha/beta fold hydrolase [Phycisphaerales bacterium]|nr:alpha/beta fold hydrolase [Phycisphaerales bacterium]
MNWSIPGLVEGAARPIIGTTHLPSEEPRGRILIGHGFKGYKDYGFFPWLAGYVAEAGFVAHRFNFSRSGMDHGDGPFDEGRFLEDTWTRQVEDILALLAAVQDGLLPGGSGPVVLVGHSRGGLSSLLAAGRHAGTDALAGLRGVVSLAAPAHCLNMTPDQQRVLLDTGRVPSPSSRTGQVLQVGRAFLQEQLDDPQGHDLLNLVHRIDVPVAVVHGLDDDAVPVTSARQIISALQSEASLSVLEDANHVFNVPNPFPVDGEPSAPLAEVGAILVDFAGTVLSC